MEQCIVVGKTPLFLFDFSRKRVHGVFVAAAEPELDINSEAWKGQGPPHSRRNPGSPFPAQVKILLKTAAERVGEIGSGHNDTFKLTAGPIDASVRTRPVQPEPHII